jgi:hypothetical protein
MPWSKTQGRPEKKSEQPIELLCLDSDRGYHPGVLFVTQKGRNKCQFTSINVKRVGILLNTFSKIVQSRSSAQTAAAPVWKGFFLPLLPTQALRPHPAEVVALLAPVLSLESIGYR